MLDQNKLLLGVKNLLLNCAELRAGDKLLIISEKESLGWYKDDAAKAVFSVAEALGIKCKVKTVGAPGDVSLKEIELIMSNYDCTIFFARIGDQNRFEITKNQDKRVMCYAKSAQQISSSFGRINHNAMIDMKSSINSIFLNSKNIEVSCPLGTKIRGKMLDANYYATPDVSILRFPMVVPMPILCLTFSGKILIAKYLTSTGSQSYDPISLRFSQAISVEIKNGRIGNVAGLDKDVRNFKNHYSFVAEKFGLDKDNIHSWHAGIHPGTRYDKNIDANPDQWANSIFGSPHYLHFHTCGELPPGEICWMIFDPTIIVDSNFLWRDGLLNVNEFDATRKCLEKWPELKLLYA